MLHRSKQAHDVRVGRKNRTTRSGKDVTKERRKSDERVREFDVKQITALAMVPILVLAFGLTSCANVSQGISNNPKATLGGMLGATSGGLIAAAAGGGTAGIIGGVLLGGLVGGAIGNHLDQKDKQLAMQNAQQTFEHARTGEASAWRNPDSGNSGTITPTSTYQNSSGQYCREYQQQITIGGELHESYGTACRQPDGTWKTQG